MDKKGAKGYWISTSTVFNQELFDKYAEKAATWLKKFGGEIFTKDTEPQGKERTENANLAVICKFPSFSKLSKHTSQKSIKIVKT